MDLGKAAGITLIGGSILDSTDLLAVKYKGNIKSNIFVAKNGTPAENVAKVIDMRFGGIENLVNQNDIVVINPNGQWPNQGGSNCACCMGLIDLIINRPGGFDGEIIFCENTQFQANGYWTATGGGLDRNGPYNFNDMISYYHANGHPNVNGVRIWRNVDDPVNWPVVSGPEEGQGWVRPEWTSPVSGCLFYLSYPIIESPYSGRFIDLKNGIYNDGYDNEAKLRFIKTPNLNNHGSNAQQDYAGITSGVKSFLGITDLEGLWNGPFPDGHRHLHTYHDTCHGSTPAQRAFSCGEAVGAWMTICRRPDIVLTTAEWVGWGSRTGTDATQARTVGLADDPASLDYYMAKYVMWPLHSSQQYFNPDYDISNNMTRQTINGAVSQGHGTADESEMAAYVYDFDSPSTFRFDIDRMIKRYNDGSATLQQVFDLIEQYNEGL
jgi:hypothetical protein